MGRREIIHVIKSWFALIILIMIHTSHLPRHTHCHIHVHISQPTPPNPHPHQNTLTCSSILEMFPRPAAIFTLLRYTPHALEILWVTSPLPGSHNPPHSPIMAFAICVLKACLLWSPLDCEQESYLCCSLLTKHSAWGTQWLPHNLAE